MTRAERTRIAPLIAALSVVGTADAYAQNFDTQTLQPAHGPHGAFSTEGSGVLEHGTFGIGGLLNYSSRPIVVIEDDPNEPGESVAYPVVDQQLALHVLGAVGVADWFQVGLDVPIYVISEGDLPEPFNEMSLGDIRLRAKGRVFGPGWDDGLGLAVALDATAPTGDGDAYVGADGPTIAPRLVLDWRYDAFWIGLNQGFLFRPSESFGANASIGNALTFGAAAEVEVMRGTLLVTADLFGRTPLDDIGQRDSSPVEALLGAKLVTTSGVSVVAAAGGGVVSGVGAPDFRMVFGVAYAPRDTDFDDDGIPNRVDRCPEDPEDLDGFEDEDGCPDPDNDGDGIPDAADQCPDEPEDFDGFEDADGCPDPDNDGDGILDVDDACPDEPEDFDGFQDEDGCPDPDNDGDGVPDEEDGCPDDVGMFEYGGCLPDDLKASVEEAAIVTTEQVTFEEKQDVILDSSHDLLDQVAFQLRIDPTIAEVEVGVHTDTRGSTASNLELSQRRADAVREYLVARGVTATRLRAVGYGESQPVARGSSSAAHEANRRVVFTIVRRGAPAGAESINPTDDASETTGDRDEE